MWTKPRACADLGLHDFIQCAALPETMEITFSNAIPASLTLQIIVWLNVLGLHTSSFNMLIRKVLSQILAIIFGMISHDC